MPAAATPKTDSLVTFTWEGEICRNVGWYEAGAYTEKQLRDTYALVSSLGMMTSTTAFTIEDYTDAHFAKAARDLQQEYDSLANALRRAEVVPTAFWQNIKKLRTRQLEERFQLNKYALEAYRNPSVLRRNPYYYHCQEYADALASADTVAVMQAWKKLTEAQKLKNGVPEMLQERFEQEYASAERMNYAKLQLMTFGWYNCANQQLKYNDLSDHYPLDQNYDKLFKRMKSECDDVD